ncbi:hypothetical protein ACFQU7_06180 [Pseudoroseomonas wenyumeiae]
MTSDTAPASTPEAPAFVPPTVAAFHADAQRDVSPPAPPPSTTPPQIDGAAAPEKPATPPATPTT